MSGLLPVGTVLGSVESGADLDLELDLLVGARAGAGAGAGASAGAGAGAGAGADLRRGCGLDDFAEADEEGAAGEGPCSASLLMDGESSLSMLKRVGRLVALVASQLWSSFSCTSAMRLERPA
jgi:hypothetical protein